MGIFGICTLPLYYIQVLSQDAKRQESGCSLVVRIPRCGRGDLGSNPSSHTFDVFLKTGSSQQAATLLMFF